MRLMTAAEIARALGGACRSGAWWRCRCPVHESGGPTLALRDGERALVTYCHGGCDRRDILAELRRRGLLDSGTRQDSPPSPAMRPNHRREERDADDRRRVLIAHDIWHRARDPRGTLVERYLASRGLALPDAPVLRYAASLRHLSGIHLPAMIARIDNVDGRMTAIHRTWLRPDGSGKADIDRPRAALAPTNGGAVRLGVIRAGDWLAVGEGIETTLSVMQACSLPGWAALSAGGIERLILPPEAHMVVIAADHDANGTGGRTAYAAAERWVAEGRRVRIPMPPEPGTDFNDVLMGRGDTEMRDVAA
jgi:putative DNA primase/helicase